MCEIISGNNLDIITAISENDKSAVFLVSDRSNNFFILKKLNGVDQTVLFDRIRSIDSSYFPKIIQVEYSDGSTYILEEYIAGNLLNIVLEKEIEKETGYFYINRLLEAVTELHSMNPPLIHRDIKPQNIIITESGELKLLDFDAVREHSEEKQQDTRMLGTRGYASPEQYGFSQTDERSDIYSLGIVCGLIADKMLISGIERRALKKKFDKATMFDPKKRFRDVFSFAQAINDVRNKYSAKIKILISLVAGIIVCLVAGFIFINSGYGQKGMPQSNAAKISFFIREKEENMYGMSIVPEEYVYKSIGEYCADIVPADADFLHGEFYFMKAYPQALLLYNPLFENLELAYIVAARYTEDRSRHIENIILSDIEDCFFEKGFICIGADTMSGFAPGYYDLVIKATDFSEWKVTVFVYAKDIHYFNMDPIPSSEVFYYSRSTENDIFINVLNTKQPIESISVDDKQIDPSEYYIAKDGKGFALKGDYIGRTFDGDFSVDINMRNGKTISVRIAFIQ